MRIAFDHQIFGWQKYGGISRYALETAKWLTENHQNDVHIVSPFYVNEYLKRAKKNFHLWGMPVRPLPRTGRVLRSVNKSLSQPIIHHIKPDIIHETYYATKGLTYKSAKTVLTVHDMIHELYPNNFHPKDPTSREKKSAVQRADHIICISKNTQKDLIDIFNIAPEKTSVVYLGVAFPSDNHAAKKEVLAAPYFLYVGLRGGYKNFKAALQAFALSSDLKTGYKFVCFGGGEFRKEELQLISDLGLNSNDVLHKSGSDELLACLYRGAAAFIYPSLYEGFGIPPLEAMSCGCPVICSDRSSIPEVVGDAGHYFNPTNPDDIKDAMETIVSNYALREQLKQKGVETVKNFTWEKCANETQKVYKKALHE